MSRRRGLNRDSFPFHATGDLHIDVEQEAMRSLFGHWFIGVSDAARVWDAPYVPIPEDMLTLFRGASRTLCDGHAMYYDPGVSPRQMYEQFGQESVNEDFERLYTT